MFPTCLWALTERKLRFKIIAVVLIKATFFWDVTLCDWAY